MAQGPTPEIRSTQKLLALRLATCLAHSSIVRCATVADAVDVVRRANRRLLDPQHRQCQRAGSVTATGRSPTQQRSQSAVTSAHSNSQLGKRDLLRH